MSSARMNPKTALKTLILQKGQGRAPARLSRNFRAIDAAGVAAVTASLHQNYFTRPMGNHALTTREYLLTAEGQRDLKDHVETRLEHFRNTIIPWLDATRPLSGAKILEIGCGTGSSTVALAEQGATVTAVDIDEESLAVARDRCRAYGLDVDTVSANATAAHELRPGQHFDFVIFFACLEHMTHDERLVAMRNTWNSIEAGAFWCVIETPNRLWHFDGHTALMPFFLWLPDDLAMKYSRLSPRRPFNTTYRDPSGESMLQFLREGRGVSYHEFDLAIGPAQELDVVSSLPLYLRKRSPLWTFGRRLTQSPNHRYEALLRELGPRIHEGFYQSSLDLIIRKR